MGYTGLARRQNPPKLKKIYIGYKFYVQFLWSKTVAIAISFYTFCWKRSCQWSVKDIGYNSIQLMFTVNMTTCMVCGSNPIPDSVLFGRSLRATLQPLHVACCFAALLSSDWRLHINDREGLLIFRNDLTFLGIWNLFNVFCAW